MKAISLWQPWAQLIAFKEKKIETRSWPTNYRGPLAIHATIKPASYYIDQLPYFTIRDMREALERHDCNLIDDDNEAAYGAVIATCILKDCSRMYGHKPINGIVRPEYGIRLDNGMVIDGNTPEYQFGLYNIGRYAWILEDIQPLPEPVPAKGMQGLWEWKEAGQ